MAKKPGTTSPGDHQSEVPGSAKTLPPDPVGPIVSSAHLMVDGASLSEFEYGMIVANHAFERWMVRCATAAGLTDLAPLDVLVLHSINHRNRPKKIADLCFVLNVEDTHTVTYAIKKLEKQGLLSASRQGKERLLTTSEKGRRACEHYREIREACLISSLRAMGTDTTDVESAARILRTISGYYDQAARAAASL